MNPEHRILNRRSLPVRHHGSRQPFPHHPALLLAVLFLGVFTIFALCILASKLSPDKMTGYASSQNVSARVNITGVSFYNCTTDLTPGTIMRSFNCLPLNTPIERFLGNLSSGGAHVGSIYTYTPWTSGKWRAYNASLPPFVVQSLSSMSNLDGYYLVMRGSETFFYSGFLPLNSSVYLRRGWNLVGYPSNHTRFLNETLSSISSTYTYFETLNGSEESGAYLFDVPPPMNNSLNRTAPFEAYWINVTANDAWVVNQ